MNQLIVIENNQNYGLVTSSRDIALGLKKEHKNVIRDLENILENKEKLISSNLSRLIIPSNYRDRSIFYEKNNIIRVIGTNQLFQKAR